MQAEKADAERCAAGLAEQLERAQRAAAEAALEADAARAAVIAKAAAEQARAPTPLLQDASKDFLSDGQTLYCRRLCI